MVVKPRQVLSRFSGARRSRGRSFLASSNRYWYSVLSLLLGANRTPSVRLPVVTSTQVIGVVRVLSLPWVKLMAMSGSSLTVHITGCPFFRKFQLTAKKKVFKKLRAPPATWTPCSHAWALVYIIASTSFSSFVCEVSHCVTSSTKPSPLRAV
jgi:hypothetical protein